LGFRALAPISSGLRGMTGGGHRPDDVFGVSTGGKARRRWQNGGAQPMSKVDARGMGAKHVGMEAAGELGGGSKLTRFIYSTLILYEIQKAYLHLYLQKLSLFVRSQYPYLQFISAVCRGTSIYDE
jgi:hypothetical protein